jgi:UDP-N-acetylglucosamine 2-epimerase (non-hydrolysing)
VAEFPDIQVAYPVHLNPHVQDTFTQLLSGVDWVHLLPPLDYLSFLHLMRLAYLVMTDSGGVLEEAPTFQKPVLVIRAVTERPEAVQTGIARRRGALFALPLLSAALRGPPGQF